MTIEETIEKKKEENIEKELNKQMLEEQRVIVRIWTSGVNRINPGESVGHVSIEVPKEKLYWSLWPRQSTYNTPAAQETEGLGLIKPITPEPITDFTYKKDLDFEGRQPELTYCLYTLKVYNMKDKFEKLCQSKIKWNFVGRLFFLNAGSCASSAWELLNAGGITDLVSIAEQSSIASKNSGLGSYLSSFWFKRAVYEQAQGNHQQAREASFQAAGAAIYSAEQGVGLVINSPDHLGELIKKAKAHEQEKEPLTTDITFAGESEITPAPQRAWCQVL